MLNWLTPFNIFCFLDNNDYSHDDSRFDCLLAAGAYQQFESNEGGFFESLSTFCADKKDWLFGHFNYPSLNKDRIDFPNAFFFIPEIMIKLSGNRVSITSKKLSPEIVFKQIENKSAIFETYEMDLDVKSVISESAYLDTVSKLKQHIQRGDCYEINFCQEFFAENTTVNPVSLFHKLNTISPNPFAALYRIHDKYCICASPERFIQKKGDTIISQPIKGTSKRFPDNPIEDEKSKANLLNSEKERSENVMIVDLVRNDLSKCCKEGAVNVKELFGIYSFPQVHQMISTIEGKVDENIHWTSIIESCYPMGSMTGAPKKRVMELIETYEATPRGLFSGTIGYVSDDGDFDFNVVIRSIFYNEKKCLISFKAGGGITINSVPELEYQESLMKAMAIKNILQKHPS